MSLELPTASAGPYRRCVLTALAAFGLGGPALLTALAGCGSTASASQSARSSLARRTMGPGDLTAGSRMLTTFAGALVSRLASTQGNLVCSPYSVALALAMTRAGAGGRTAAEMDAALGSSSAAGLDRGYDAVAQHLATLAGTKKNGSGKDAEVALEVASTLFGQTGLHWKEPFLDELAAGYGAGLELVDYVKAAEPARLRINSWTADHTAGLIHDLLPKGFVRPDTRLVLVNALHLKAPWHRAFEKASTTQRAFHLADGSVAEVPMMSSADVASSYAEGQGWRGAQLPYAGQQLAMTLLLPDAGREQELITRLSTGLSTEVDSFGQPSDVLLPRVVLPRFNLRWGTTSLRDVLEEMGLRVTFTDDADFTGMTDDERLHVDDVAHQATITVDEEGTESRGGDRGRVGDGRDHGPARARARPALPLRRPRRAVGRAPLRRPGQRSPPGRELTHPGGHTAQRRSLRCPKYRRLLAERRRSHERSAVPNRPGLPGVERELTRLLRRARATSGAIAAEVHPALDPASYAVLITVVELSETLTGGVRAADVAERLRLHKSTMSRNITVLERIGLLERLPSPSDARARLLHLTDTGSELLTAALSARRARIADALSRWSVDDLGALASLLGRLNDDLD